MINFYEFQQILENAHPYGDWEDHFDNDTEAGVKTAPKKTKNAPQGHRNAECSRCGNKEKAKLYDINAGKAKCKNCGGYLNLISTENNENKSNPTSKCPLCGKKRKEGESCDNPECKETYARSEKLRKMGLLSLD